MSTGITPQMRTAVSESGHSVMAHQCKCPIERIGIRPQDRFKDDDMEMLVSMEYAASPDEIADPAETQLMQAWTKIYIAGKWAAYELTGSASRHDYDDQRRGYALLQRITPAHPDTEFNYYRYALTRTVQRMITSTRPDNPSYGDVLLALAMRLCSAGTMTGADAFQEIDRLLASWPQWKPDVDRWWPSR